MLVEKNILETLESLKTMAPSGYAIALHIRFSTPTFLFQTYAKDWADYYSAKGLVMQDPTVAWGFANEGAIRWSELADQDAAGVFAAAADHGLVYGVTFGIATGSDRSMASAACHDSEYSDAEIEKIAGMIQSLHSLTSDLSALSPDAVERLKKLSVTVAQNAQR